MGPRAERRDATRERILAVATELFATKGYDATAIPEVLAATGLSRGALYHHFASKEELFTAVLEQVEGEVADRVVAAARSAASPSDAVVRGCTAFLRMAREPAVTRIVLTDAPAVVGWERWREIDARFAFGLLKTGLDAARGGPRPDSDLVAHVVLAALLEVALLVARSDRPRAAIRDGEAVLRDLVAAVTAR
jgi:AcrR family transcriptional regulator